MAKEDWKRIVLPEETWEKLRVMWEGDAEAQRRGQKFNPWVSMVLAEWIEEYRRGVHGPLRHKIQVQESA